MAARLGTVAEQGLKTMPLSFTDDLVGIDWEELSALYRIAPLGDKSAADLKLVFTNSIYRLFAHDAGTLVGQGRVLTDGRERGHIERP